MTRESLPNRRGSTVLTLDFEGARYHVMYSRFPDGRLAEVFISAGKVGAALNVMARDLALVTSLALQFGVPVETMIKALEQEIDGTMRGPLGAMLKIIEKAEKP